MLYYIVPPIIMIASVSALIYFLFRKAEEMPASQVQEQREALGDVSEAWTAKAKDAIVHGWLKMLERIMHRAKLISLKFHNISNERFHAIRKKRQEIVEQEREQEELERAQEEVIDASVQAVKSMPRMDAAAQQKKEDARPLVRSEITRPEKRALTAISKNQLEDVLIKRIALNPRDIEAYERLGDYYMEIANNRDALECFRQVLRLNPQHHKAKLRVRRIERNMMRG